MGEMISRRNRALTYEDILKISDTYHACRGEKTEDETFGKYEDSIEVKFADETVWLSQKMIAKLFDVDRTVITKHLKNIFESNELDEKSNMQKMHFSHSDKPIKSYTLDVIISVGYKVNPKRATQFRIWATNVIKQFALNVGSC